MMVSDLLSLICIFLLAVALLQNINTDSSDYTLPSDVTLGSGVNENTFDVVIVGDTDVEETECFEVTLTAASTGSLAPCLITTTICIKDDDTTSKWCLSLFHALRSYSWIYN